MLISLIYEGLMSSQWIDFVVQLLAGMPRCQFNCALRIIFAIFRWMGYWTIIEPGQIITESFIWKCTWYFLLFVTTLINWNNYMKLQLLIELDGADQQQQIGTSCSSSLLYYLTSHLASVFTSFLQTWRNWSCSFTAWQV